LIRWSLALRRAVAVLSLSALLAAPKPLCAQGIALSGVGPVNRAMGGAATAAPIDALGAIQWNPASIGGLADSEVAFGLELLLPTETLSSSIQPGALGHGFPPVLLAGSTLGEPGASPIPTAALVQKIADSPWTLGFGMFGIGGFRVNYPSSLTNPVLMPPPPSGVGLGHVFADAQFLQIVPTASPRTVTATARGPVGAGGSRWASFTSPTRRGSSASR
jgi:long-chain fatty acid transport protein